MRCARNGFVLCFLAVQLGGYTAALGTDATDIATDLIGAPFRGAVGATPAEKMAEPTSTEAGKVRQAGLELPIELKRRVDPPTIGELYGHAPDFHVNIPGFDSLNRAYIRERRFDPHFRPEEENYWSVTGDVHRMGFGSWDVAQFDDAIRAHLGCGSCDVCYFRAGGDNNAQIVFDQDDRAYTVVHARPCGGGRLRLLMLHSADFGATWQVLQLPYAGQFALERPYSPEPLEGPPAVLLYSDLGQHGLCGGDTSSSWMGGFGTLRLVKPIVGPKGLTTLPEVQISANAMHVGSHSGGGTQIITHGGKVYVVWGEARADVKNRRCPLGSPVWMAAYDIGAAALLEAGRGQVTKSRPTNDGHNRSAIAMDTFGYLHVVVGSHNCPFQYLKALTPEAVPADESGWSEPVSTIPYTSLESCYSKATVPPQARQTYVGLVRDREDRLHLSFRQYYKNEGYYLNHQSKPATGNWPRPEKLIKPPQSNYGIYYHQMTIDHYGQVYLLLSYYTDAEPSNSWFEDGNIYKYSTMLVGRDGDAGWEWHWATTETFHAATHWEPDSGAVGDIDGNGLKDALHVYWKHGLNVHIDRSYQNGGVWQGWNSRGRRFTDGPGVLQYPVLSGNVNGTTEDSRDDLVFVFRHWATNALTIRTNLSQADGSFLALQATETDGPFVPDTTYTNLIPLMGDTDGDGRADIVFLYRGSCGLNIRTKRSNGDGTWTTSTVCNNHPVFDAVNIHNSLLHPPLIGRVNNDDRSDLVFVFRDPKGPDGVAGTSDDNYLATLVKTSTPSGGWTSGTLQWHSDGPGIHQYRHLMGDVDGDGRHDLVFLFRHWSTGLFSIRVKFSNGDGTFGPSVQTSHPDDSQIPHYTPMIGDVNGDGCADILFPHRPASDAYYRIRTFLAICDGSQSAQWERRLTMLP